MLICAEMKQDLFLLFSPCGEILEINIKKAYKMKGQAFIVFKEVSQAGDAMRRLQGFKVFGKEINIQYAKTKSDAILKKEGTFNPMAKKRMKKRDGKQVAEEAKIEEMKEEKKEEAKTAQPVSIPFYNIDY